MDSSGLQDLGSKRRRIAQGCKACGLKGNNGSRQRGLELKRRKIAQSYEAQGLEGNHGLKRRGLRPERK